MKNTLLTTTFAALSVACAGAADAGVVAYYSFDSDFTDASATTGGGTLTGTTGTITSAAGDVAFGTGAVRMDGTGPMSLAETVTFDSTDSWSVAFWGKRGSDADVASGMVLADGNSTFVWTPDNNTTTGAPEGLRFRSNVGVAGNGANQRDTDYDDTTADFSIYRHWAVVADGSSSNVKIYMDGEEVVSKDDAQISTVFSLLGGWGGNAPNNYDGVIDELYIYDEAISASQVSALVPEPGSLALLGLGGLCVLRRRR